MHFWPIDRSRGQDKQGVARIIGYPDASYRNNSDSSSQRGQCVLLAKPRDNTRHSAGSLVDYESQKIRRTTFSTTVAELYSLMNCFGTCQFIRGLWMDISGEASPIHMRTGAHNLVSTAHTCRSKRRPFTWYRCCERKHVQEKWRIWDMSAPSIVCRIA